ncbi:Z1 domain-containing protein [Rhodoflexus caldus]|uniref:Z1 domain-containing protein n=1 Tax=Rhodoflexus caldus TaxID=2891236 RepID=UPI00202AB041|nr:Z1 domain-containing protein [Rhodoflexus caldus]
MENWTPIVGEETEQLLEYLKLDEVSTKILLKETKSILALCGSPKQQTNSETGLVFGYVQSGKTMSFTTLTALAKDNDYQIIIVIAGISTNLLDQSTKRLEKDLRLNERFDRKWLGVKKNPTNTSTDRDDISTVLKEWKNPTFPEDERRTVLITVMKNPRHLQNLIDVLQRLDLREVPTLIIDDEGDQASLNTKAMRNAMRGLTEEELSEQDLSTIYRRIIELKEILPHHTFIQYTATPQANLFINILDRLSPNFIKLLTPGDAYTGGSTFFIDNHTLVRPIPIEDIATDEEPLETPPQSLIYAMQLFFLGVAAGKIKKDTNNRSMMIHPSRLQLDQRLYFDWANSIKERFVTTLQMEDDEFDKLELIKEFEKAYQDLKRTVQDLPSFENLLGNKLKTDRLEHAISSTKIEEVNSRQGKTPLINWKDHYAYILVGGQSLDRGFTVEGLTVTYMPRPIGVGTVDTIQQRARFFGYKRKYLGYCRIYLDEPTINAYRHYVEHEEDLRKSLTENNLANRHLNDWEREAVLERAYQLARKNVFSNEFERFDLSNEWFRISAPHDLDNIIDNNRKVTQSFITSIQHLLQEDNGHAKRTDEQKHSVCKISVRRAFDDYLMKLKFTRDSDSEGFTALKSVILRYLEAYPNSEATIFLMKKGQIRERQLTKKDEIQQLFQGKNPRTGEIIYPGDSEIKEFANLTIQIHNLNLINRDTGEVFENVYTIAVWIPESMNKSIIRLGKQIN